MFQLIVSVMSIVLATVLAIASVFYGGSAYLQSQQKAKSATLINMAKQISSAMIMYVSDWGTMPVIQDQSMYQQYKGASLLTDSSQWYWIRDYIGPTTPLYCNFFMPLLITGAALDTLCTDIALELGNKTPYYSDKLVPQMLPQNVLYGCVGSSAGATFNYTLPLNVWNIAY